MPVGLDFNEGKLNPNERPGLGVELDMSKLKQVAEYTERVTARAQTYFRPDGSIAVLPPQSAHSRSTIITGPLSAASALLINWKSLQSRFLTRWRVSVPSSYPPSQQDLRRRLLGGLKINPALGGPPVVVEAKVERCDFFALVAGRKL
jgi:hypothetical protein